jgi:hypothetical protein
MHTSIYIHIDILTNIHYIYTTYKYILFTYIYIYIYIYITYLARVNLPMLGLPMRVDRPLLYSPFVDKSLFIIYIVVITYVFVYICMYINIYIYIYIYTCLNIHIYKYIYVYIAYERKAPPVLSGACPALRS